MESQVFSQFYENLSLNGQHGNQIQTELSAWHGRGQSDINHEYEWRQCHHHDPDCNGVANSKVKSNQTWTTIVEEDEGKVILENIGKCQISFRDKLTFPKTIPAENNQNRSYFSSNDNKNDLSKETNSILKQLLAPVKNSIGFQTKWPCGGTVNKYDYSSSTIQEQLNIGNETNPKSSSTYKKVFAKLYNLPTISSSVEQEESVQEPKSKSIRTKKNADKPKKISKQKPCNSFTVSIPGGGQLFSIPIVVRPPSKKRCQRKSSTKKELKPSRKNKKDSKDLKLDDRESSEPQPLKLNEKICHDQEDQIVKYAEVEGEAKPEEKLPSRIRKNCERERKCNKKERKIGATEITITPRISENPIKKAYKGCDSIANTCITISDDNMNNSSTPYTVQGSNNSEQEAEIERKLQEKVKQAAKDPAPNTELGESEENAKIKRAHMANTGVLRHCERNNAESILAFQGHKRNVIELDPEELGREEAVINDDYHYYYNDDDYGHSENSYDLESENNETDENSITVEYDDVTNNDLQDMIDEFILVCPCVSPWSTDVSSSEDEVESVQRPQPEEEKGSGNFIGQMESLKLEIVEEVNQLTKKVGVEEHDNRKSSSNFCLGKLGPYAHLHNSWSVQQTHPAAFENPFDIVTQSQCLTQVEYDIVTIDEDAISNQKHCLQYGILKQNGSRSSEDSKKMRSLQHHELQKRDLKMDSYKHTAQIKARSLTTRKLRNEVKVGSPNLETNRTKTDAMKKSHVAPARSKNNLIKSNSRIWTADNNPYLPPTKRKIHDHLNKIFQLGKPLPK